MNRLLTALACLALSSVALAGDLNPPSGAVAPTMKTLDQVEARIPIGPLTTPGDSDSVYKITQPGSYYLTGNLIGEAGKYGIEVIASNVSIDLNGYSLLGVPGALYGITDRRTDEFENIRNLAVSNGSISDFPQGGIVMEYCSTARFSDLTIRGGQYGIYQRTAMIVENCVVSNVTSIGIFAEYSSTITRALVANAPVGIQTFGSAVIDSTTRSCATGFDAYESTLDNCIAMGGTTGVKLGLRSRLVNSRITNNSTGVLVEEAYAELRDCSISSSSSTGVSVLGINNRIVGNSIIASRNIAGNYGVAISVDAASAGNVIEANTGTGNYFGLVVNGTNNVITRNAFGATVGLGSQVQYQIAAGNRFGSLVKANTNGVQTSVSGGSSTVAGTMSTTDPNANIFW
jgi:hypothetical protein